jgi:hypothetical protein
VHARGNIQLNVVSREKEFATSSRTNPDLVVQALGAVMVSVPDSASVLGSVTALGRVTATVPMD